ncbi:MAG: peptidoglycan-associated lipoprotein Pal [Verrucomicrobiia bacterium]|jgi:peptidoglycan-associated lipoprotein
MKTIRQIGLFAICITFAIATIGCKSSKKQPTVTQLPSAATPGTTTSTQGTEPTMPPIQPGGTPSATDLTKIQSSTDLPEPKGLENMIPDREFFRAQIVYFDFDRSAIKESEKSKLDFVAKYLKENNETKIQIEGHCDERGTEEYNRALGERRALAAREYLINAGVSGTRIYTISYGEDKPADPGHNEAAWAKNRRCEFILYRPRK